MVKALSCQWDDEEYHKEFFFHHKQMKINKIQMLALEGVLFLSRGGFADPPEDAFYRPLQCLARPGRQRVPGLRPGRVRHTCPPLTHRLRTAVSLTARIGGELGRSKAQVNHKKLKLITRSSSESQEAQINHKKLK